MNNSNEWPHNGLLPPAKPIVYTAAELLATLKAELSNQIDSVVLAIYEKPIALSEEYKAREKAAIDYKAAGYTGVVPARLLSFATSAGLTATVAADLVLSLASQLRIALDSLSDLRMRKFEVQNATNEADARLLHADVMAKIAVIAESVK